MSSNSFKVKNSLQIKGNTTATDEAGDIRFDPSDSKFKAHDGATEAQVIRSGDLADLTYDNTTSGLAATDPQAAIDEVEDRVQTAEADIVALETDVATRALQTDLDTTNSTIATIQSELDAAEADIATAQSTADTHIADTANPHSVTAAQVGNTTAQWNADKIQGADVPAPTSSENGKALIYNDSTGAFEYGVAGGSSGINHIDADSANCETSTGNWELYADAASDIPWDATGGTSVNLSISHETTNPLRGTGSLRITKAAANAQGEGVSIPFTVDQQDLDVGKLWGSFDYKASSGYATDDLMVYIVEDGTNNLIVPNCNPTSKRQQFSFTPTAGVLNYRLVLHVASTSTTAWTFDVDNVSVGPTALLDGPVHTYLGQLTTTGDLTTNTSYEGHYWRNDDHLKAAVRVDFSGAPNAVPFNLNLPAGLTIDATKVLGTTSFVNSFGNVDIFDVSGALVYKGRVAYNSTTSVRISVEKATTTSADHVYRLTVTSGSAPVTFAAGDVIYIRYEVPISEWANSSALMSTTALMNEGVSVNAQGNASASITNTTSYFPVSMATIVSSGNGAYDGTTFTAPEDGEYDFHFRSLIQGTWSAGGLLIAGLSVDDVGVSAGTSYASQNRADAAISTFRTAEIVQTIDLVKGQTVTPKILTAGTSPGFPAGASLHHFSVRKRQTFTVYGGYSEPNRVQRKTLSANVTSNGTVSELTFSNLTIGKFYEVTGQVHVIVGSGATDTGITLDPVHDGETLATPGVTVADGNTTADNSRLGVAFKFKATATTLTFVAGSATANSYIVGGGNRSGTYIELEERNDLIETDAW